MPRIVKYFSLLLYRISNRPLSPTHFDPSSFCSESSSCYLVNAETDQQHVGQSFADRSVELVEAQIDPGNRGVGLRKSADGHREAGVASGATAACCCCLCAAACLFFCCYCPEEDDDDEDVVLLFYVREVGVRIINKLELNKPIYKKTAAYGHFGRAPEADGSFSWEKTDMVNIFKKEV